jgi:hypothetical protein
MIKHIFGKAVKKMSEVMLYMNGEQGRPRVTGVIVHLLFGLLFLGLMLVDPSGERWQLPFFIMLVLLGVDYISFMCRFTHHEDD